MYIHIFLVVDLQMVNCVAALVALILLSHIPFSYAGFKLDLSLRHHLSIQNPLGPNIIDPSLRLEMILKGVEFPTSMAFLGPNDILILEKNNGTVKRITNGSMLPEPLLDVNVANKGERGMLGIAIAKRDYGPMYVFLFYTESVAEDGEDITKGKDPICSCLYRYELVDNKLVNPKMLLNVTAIPGGKEHYPDHIGGKVLIGPDQNVYVVIGDVGSHKGQAQNVQGGQPFDGTSGILRIAQNGEPIKGKPNNKGGITDAYYAYGIRNSFGMDFDPVTKILWNTENGPRFGDEINLVKPGFNSGWDKVQGIWKLSSPQKSYFPESVTSQPSNLTDFGGVGKYSSPNFIWSQSVGLTALKFLNSDKLGKQYENDMLVGDFHNGNIYHFELDTERTELSTVGTVADKIANNNSETESIIFGRGFGAIMDLKVGPDGYLYILSLAVGGNDCIPRYQGVPCVSYTSSNPGSIFRVVPNNY
jgi:aldose sugar dehydrogenase